MAIRLALRTSSWQVSELVLGAGAYSESLDSSTLLAEYKGVGILRGAAGTLSGMAAGLGFDQLARDVLDDVLAVFDGVPCLRIAATSRGPTPPIAQRGCSPHARAGAEVRPRGPRAAGTWRHPSCRSRSPPSRHARRTT